MTVAPVNGREKDEAAAEDSRFAIVEQTKIAPDQRIAWIWCAAFCAGAAILILSTLVTIVRLYTPLPVWDYWSEVLWLKSYYSGTWHFADLWRQHNEHRIFFPRFFLLADLLLFRGTNVFLLTSILLLHACTAAIFLRELWKSKDVDHVSRVTLCGVILVLFFSSLNLENFTWSFQVCFILVQFAAAVSIWMLAGVSGGSPRPAGLILCLASAVVASYSLGNGPLIWPALLITGLGLRIRWRTMLLISGVAGVTIGVFVIGYHSASGSSNPITALRQPLRVLHFGCGYLGLPVWAVHPDAGVIVGVLILAIVAWQLCWFAWRKPKCSRLFGTSLGVAAFVTMSAFLTGAGRSGLTLRYVTPVSLLWVALICGAISHPGYAPPGRRHISAAIAAAIAVLVGVILPVHMRAIEASLGASANHEDTETAFSMGIVYDAPPISAILPVPRLNYKLVDLLREHHLSIFATSTVPIGQRLQDRYNVVSSDYCQGAWESSAEVQSVLEGGAVSTATGWAWDVAAHQRPWSVLLTDESQTIRGIARFDRDRADIADRFGDNAMKSAGWFGYFRRTGSSKYRAYAVLRDRTSVCPLTNPEAIASSLLAIYRGGTWWIDSNRSGGWDTGDRTFSFGLPGDTPVVGDWDGSGVFRLGVFRKGDWILDWNNSGNPRDARTFSFGLPGDIPVVGDWGHTGKSKFGVFRNGLWILDWNGNGIYDSGDRQFSFGLPGDYPVAGDWDGSGVVRIGVYRKGQWILDTNGSFSYDGRYTTVFFGLPDDQPVVGDWKGLGVVRLGIFRRGTWVMRSSGIEQPTSEETYASFGLPGDVAVPWRAK